jgi:hypothetical protein
MSSTHWDSSSAFSLLILPCVSISWLIKLVSQAGKAGQRHQSVCRCCVRPSASAPRNRRRQQQPPIPFQPSESTIDQSARPVKKQAKAPVNLRVAPRLLLCIAVVVAWPCVAPFVSSFAAAAAAANASHPPSKRPPAVQLSVSGEGEMNRMPVVVKARTATTQKKKKKGK